MGSDTHNVTTTVVHAILTLTDAQRRSYRGQFLCQFVYCIFPITDHDDNNITCYVRPTKSSSFDDNQEEGNPIFISTTKFIVRYIYPILIFTGILGNSLSCFIMFKNVRRNGYSANLYLTLLAFVDCLFLLGSALPNWLAHLDTKLDVKFLSDFCCRLVYWFGHFTTHLSSGLVVSVTVERFIAVQYPLIASKINTVTHTHIALLLLISFFFLLDSRVLILVKRFEENIHTVLTCNNDTHIEYERRDQSRCETIDENNEHVWLFIDFAVYTLIPFLIIVTLNSLIIHRLICAQRLRQRMSQTKSRSPRCEYDNLRRNASEGHRIPSGKEKHLRRCRSVPTKLSFRLFLHSRKIERHSNSTTKQSDLSNQSSLEVRLRSDYQYESSVLRQTTNIRNKRLTVLLLFVSFSFLLLTLPAVVINLLMATNLKVPSFIHTTHFHSTYNNLDTNTSCYYFIARLLMVLNHSINFILYFVVGKRFRQDLKTLCCRC